jgi:hypothetical protein
LPVSDWPSLCVIDAGMIMVSDLTVEEGTVAVEKVALLWVRN